MDWGVVDDKKSLEQFRNLIERTEFQSVAKEVRKELGYPDNGWPNGKFDFYKLFGSDDNAMACLNKAVQTLQQKFKFKKNLEELVLSYLADPHFLTKEKQLPRKVLVRLDSFGVSLDWINLFSDGEPATLYITAGATKRDVLNFLNDWWWFIDGQLRRHHPEDYLAGRIRIKKYRERDRKIIKLYEKGLIKTDGHLKNNKVAEFLKTHGIEVGLKFVGYKQSLRDLGYELPSEDAIRKIIQQHKRKGRN